MSNNHRLGGSSTTNVLLTVLESGESMIKVAGGHILVKALCLVYGQHLLAMS